MSEELSESWREAKDDLVVDGQVRKLEVSEALRHLNEANASSNGLMADQVLNIGLMGRVVAKNAGRLRRIFLHPQTSRYER